MFGWGRKKKSFMELAKEPGGEKTVTTRTRRTTTKKTEPLAALKEKNTAAKGTTVRKATRMKNVSADVVAAGNGVHVFPTPITAGETVHVKYNGLLAKSGALQIFLHCGYGNYNWLNVKDIPMTLTNDGNWSASIKLDVDESSRLNICFRDNAYNWDNNNGSNWSYEIHNGQQI